MSHLFKVDESLWEYLGGVSIAYKLLFDNFDVNPIIVSTGPLSGYFPYVSKSCLLYLSSSESNRKVVEKYGGGSIASQLNMVGIDALVLTGSVEYDVSISINEDEVSVVEVAEGNFDPVNYDLVLSADKAIADNYFTYGDISEGQRMALKSSVGVNIDSTKNYDIYNFYEYEDLYSALLNEYKELSVEPRNNPSCMGCPMGCDLSHLGEDDLNIAVLPRSLIACGYAESLYKNIPRIYACLSSIGYNYKHDDLLNLPRLFGEVKSSVNKLITT